MFTGRFRRDVLAALTRIEARQIAQEKEGIRIMAALDDLQAQVTASTGVEESAITLIQGIAARVGDVVNAEQAKALSAQLKTSADRLAAAVAANP